MLPDSRHKTCYISIPDGPHRLPFTGLAACQGPGAGGIEYNSVLCPDTLARLSHCLLGGRVPTPSLFRAQRAKPEAPAGRKIVARGKAEGRHPGYQTHQTNPLSSVFGGKGQGERRTSNTIRTGSRSQDPRCWRPPRSAECCG
jgi:hypothetical protein